MLRYGEHWVSPEHKDEYIQSLREGVVPAMARAEDWITDLRLLTIITQTAKIWWANLPGIVLITSLIWLPTNLIVEYFSYQQPIES